MLNKCRVVVDAMCQSHMLNAHMVAYLIGCDMLTGRGIACIETSSTVKQSLMLSLTIRFMIESSNVCPRNQ